MPATNDNGPGPRPPVMTWGKAALPLGIALLFYVLRFMFEQFWFFGPALIGAIASAYFGGGSAGHVAGAVATAAAGAGEFLTGPVVEIFGAVMAMFIALLGWGTVFLIMFLSNRRLFKENSKGFLISILGFGFSIIPIIGSMPSVLGTTFELYRQQIKRDKQKLRAWETSQTAYLQQQRDAQRAQAAQIVAMRSQTEAQEADEAEIASEQQAAEDREPQTFAGEYSYEPNFENVPPANDTAPPTELLHAA